MSARIRRTLASIVATTLLCATTFVSTANAGDTSMEEAEAHTPAVFDAMVMRPLGLGALALGTGMFAIAAPIVLITRPSDMGKPFHILIVRPAKYVWVDPLGTH